MAATQINLDDQALADAAKVLGTTTKVETVNRALRFVVRHDRQRQSHERAAADGTYAGVPAGEEAWR